jgi:hypothetical protein
MSAMGDRFLLLEETADALDVIDPDLSRQFRLVNGLPLVGDGDVPWPGPTTHVAAIDDDAGGMRVTCSCGEWSADVSWDEIDDLVVAARDHFGTATGSVLDHGDQPEADGPVPSRQVS